MFRRKYFLIVLNFIFISFVNASTIYFTNPTNGSTIHNVYSSSNVAVNISYSWEATQGGYMYVKLFTHDLEYNSRVGDGIPQWRYLSTGTYYWRIELWEGTELGKEYKTAEQSISFHVKFSLSAHNNFAVGSIILEGSTVQSGSLVIKNIGDNVSVGAIDQNDGNGYYRIWNSSGVYDSDWKRNDSQIPGASSRYLNYSIASNDNGAVLTAGLRKVCGLTFQANSSMSINGNYRTSPYTESVVEQNSISALASSYSTDGIDYTFSKWSSGSGDVYSPITASEHESYTAVYTGKPNNNYRNLSFNTSQEGQPVQLTWSMHPLDNSSISHYAVYRKVTSSGTPTLLTTVSATGSSSYSYTDYEFAISNSQNKILLFYDVRPYYTPDAAYSDAAFEGVYGFYYSNKLPDEIAQNQTIQAIPEAFEVNNYPNPFNPSTTINYQLPENGFVTLKVFDILGREVATLVNENKPAGYYTVKFDASHSERSRGITSGVYIYTIRVNEITQSKKMLLAK